MARIMTGLRVPAEAVARLLKARAGLVQKRVWIKDSQGHKGYSRMAWVRPENESPGEGKGQLDMFFEPVPKKYESKTPSPSLDVMAREAARWKGAAMKVAEEIGNDKSAALRHSHMTIKADLDAYLMRKFDVDAVTAREVSNHLTHMNIKPDMMAPIDDFKDEPWYANRPNRPDSLPSAYKPRWPEKGEFAGNGLGDNGREYEGYRNGNGVRFYDTETGREIGENGEFLDEKMPATPGKYRLEYDEKGNILAPKETWGAGFVYRPQKTSSVIFLDRAEAEKAYPGEGVDRFVVGKYDGRIVYAPEGEKPAAPGDYKIYHDSFTSVVNEVIRHIDDQGLYLAENDVFNSIASGPGKPKNGRTDRYDLPLYDADGKPAKKAVHFQVYDMGNGKYELNLYTSPMKAKDYAEDKVQVRKETGITGEENPSSASLSDFMPIKNGGVFDHDGKTYTIKIKKIHGTDYIHIMREDGTIEGSVTFGHGKMGGQYFATPTLEKVKAAIFVGAKPVEVKKSRLDSFRDGLAKAFGAR